MTDQQHRSPLLHEQLANELATTIADLPEGAPIPSEAELIRTHEVSRTTVRRALAALVEAGLVVKHQGKGSFVAPRRVARSLSELGSFLEAFTDQGLDVESDLVGYEWSDSLAALTFRRVYRVDGAVWAVADCQVMEPYGSSLSRADLQRRPSFELLQERFGAIDASHLTVSCRPATAEIATLLGMPDDSWELVVRRELTNSGGAIVQHAEYHLIPDRFEFTLSEAAPAATAQTFRSPPPRLRLVSPDASA